MGSGAASVCLKSCFHPQFEEELDDKYMDANDSLIGILLLIIGFAMVAMAFTYFKTNKLNLSWMSFGFFYTAGLLILFTDNPLKNYLQISPAEKFYSFPSFIIH